MHRVGLISPPAMESLMGDAGGVANPAPTVTSGPGGGDRNCVAEGGGDAGQA